MNSRQLAGTASPGFFASARANTASTLRRGSGQRGGTGLHTCAVASAAAFVFWNGRTPASSSHATTASE